MEANPAPLHCRLEVGGHCVESVFQVKTRLIGIKIKVKMGF